MDPVEIATLGKLKKGKSIESVTEDIAKDDKVSVDLLTGANFIQAYGVNQRDLKLRWWSA